MKNALRKFANSCAEKIYSTFESNSGNMILITTATGILLSTLAQSAAITVNKKYSVSQKAFMIPQELTEGAISVATLLLTSLILKNCAGRCVESGKIITKDLKAYLQQNNLAEKIGTKDYSVTKQINLLIDNTKNTDLFERGTKEVQQSLLSPHENALLNHEKTKDATSAIVTTAGSIISTALFVPLIRNCVAAKFQPANIEIINDVRKRKAMYENKQIAPKNNPVYNNYTDRMRI